MKSENSQEHGNEEKALAVRAETLPINSHAVEELKSQRALLKDFVKSQLVEARFDEKAKREGADGQGDYGIIPGTKKRCLFKPGGEKLLKLFNYGVRSIQTDKEIDRNANFALYTYKAEIYSLKTGVVIADCEGTANSQEVKYKERTVWKKNAKGVSESSKEETPIFDILNTLQKMAQKRAMLGAIILATGASEYFTQDMLEPEDVKPPPKIKQPETEAPVGELEKNVEEIPDCCGQPMIVSRYTDRETGGKPWYCLKCKAKNQWSRPHEYEKRILR